MLYVCHRSRLSFTGEAQRGSGRHHSHTPCCARLMTWLRASSPSYILMRATHDDFAIYKTNLPRPKRSKTFILLKTSVLRGIRSQSKRGVALVVITILRFSRSGSGRRGRLSFTGEAQFGVGRHHHLYTSAALASWRRFLFLEGVFETSSRSWTKRSVALTILI